ncbi:MAG: Cof-type HAD-IIB family hydrolase [Clostridium sp.]
MKYFFFDIDGTLKPYGQKISDSTKNTIRKLQENGHKVFLATGRRRNEVGSIMSELNIKNAVCSGGATVIINNKVEKEEYYTLEELERILNDCRKNNVIMVSVGYGRCYTCYRGVRLKPYVFFMKLYSKSKRFRVGSVEGCEGANYTDIKVLSEDEFLKQPTQKLIFFNCRHIDKVHALNKYTIYNERIWKSIEFDFKEKGIDYIRKKYNVHIDDIVVFGDGINDIGMFTYAEKSIAMENSCSEIKEIASFITKRSDDDGIEYACKHFGWI